MREEERGSIWSGMKLGWPSEMTSKDVFIDSCGVHTLTLVDTHTQAQTHIHFCETFSLPADTNPLFISK